MEIEGKYSDGINSGLLVEILDLELKRRMETNPSYSLRAFAKSLDIESGYLSRILSGKRTPGKKTAEKILSSLDLSELPISTNHGNYKTLDVELFNAISDWHHYAILELTRVEGFQSNIEWIAESLGLRNEIAKEAVDRLFKLEMLVEDDEGNWKDDSGYVSTLGNNFTNKAFKNLQRQVLNKASRALDEISFEERSQSSLTFTYDEENLENLRKLIRKFESDLLEIVKTNKKKTRVYNMSFSLYPVSQSVKENE